MDRTLRNTEGNNSRIHSLWKRLNRRILLRPIFIYLFILLLIYLMMMSGSSQYTMFSDGVKGEK